MLYTNLNHIESAAQLEQIIHENENVMVICGRMGTQCIPVYRIAEELADLYNQVRFYDMEFDHPESQVIRTLAEVKNFAKIPFTIYYKNGEIVEATTGIQTKQEVKAILNQAFAGTVNA